MAACGKWTCLSEGKNLIGARLTDVVLPCCVAEMIVLSSSKPVAMASERHHLVFPACDMTTEEVEWFRQALRSTGAGLSEESLEGQPSILYVWETYVRDARVGQDKLLLVQRRGRWFLRRGASMEFIR